MSTSNVYHYSCHEQIKKKDNPQSGRKYLQKKQPTRGQTPKYKQLIQLKSNKQAIQSKKWAEDRNIHFPKEDTQPKST